MFLSIHLLSAAGRTSFASFLCDKESKEHLPLFCWCHILYHSSLEGLNTAVHHWFTWAPFIRPSTHTGGFCFLLVVEHVVQTFLGSRLKHFDGHTQMYGFKGVSSPSWRHRQQRVSLSLGLERQTQAWTESLTCSVYSISSAQCVLAVTYLIVWSLQDSNP